MTNELGLRPGNLVYNVETLSEVIEVRTDAATIRNYDVTGQEQIANIYYSGLKGVPLGESWLQKIGAEKQTEDQAKFGFEDLTLELKQDGWTDTEKQLQFKYVHEIQNYYFDKYQKDLTIDH